MVGGLWAEHLDARFPAALRGADLEGVDMVMLDAAIAGCVSTWLTRGRPLDADRRRILHGCIGDLDRVVPLLTRPEEIEYCRRLRRLAVLTSESGPSPPT
ncbi:hypothetical protein [Streptomyces sp. NPDC055060]